MATAIRAVKNIRRSWEKGTAGSFARKERKNEGHHHKTESP